VALNPIAFTERVVAEDRVTLVREVYDELLV
jgi:hypothetical protein